MELIIYNRNNVGAPRIGQKMISVYVQGGIFSLSAMLIKELDLKIGTKAIFAQQKNNSKNWFFAIVDSTQPAAFELVKDDKKLLFRCTSLARKILMSFKEPKSIRFIVTGDTQEIEGRTFYQLVPIIKQEKK